MFKTASNDVQIHSHTEAQKGKEMLQAEEPIETAEIKVLH